MGPIVAGAFGGYRDPTMSVSPNSWKSRVATALREFGAYAAIALVVPGGTLILLSVWVFRHRSWLAGHGRGDPKKSGVKRTGGQKASGKRQADTSVVDYGAARAQAIRWLGDRYLLAKPINRGYRPWRVAPQADVRSNPTGNPESLCPDAGGASVEPTFLVTASNGT